MRVALLVFAGSVAGLFWPENARYARDPVARAVRAGAVARVTVTPPAPKAPPVRYGATTIVPPFGEPPPAPLDPDTRYTTSLRILTPGGTPVARARIETFAGVFHSDRNGWVWLPRLPGDMHSPRASRRKQTITVRAPGWAPVLQRMLPSEKSPVIRLKERGAELRVQFVDPHGAPVRNIDVAINRHHTLEDFEFRIGATGRIVARDAPRVCTLFFYSQGWMPRANVVLSPGRHEQRVILYRYAEIDGVFTGGVPRREDFLIDAYLWISDQGVFQIRAIPGPCELIWKGQVLATFHLEPGDRRTGVRIGLSGAG